jgi:hypothetical protein
METRELLAVTNQQALQFFVEHLQDVTDASDPPRDELLYNASVLAHFAGTSTASGDTFPPCPTHLDTVFDLYLTDRLAIYGDPDILEAAASQCLLLTGFFQDQQRGRYPIHWYAGLGVGFYVRAAQASHERSHARMMAVMARRFSFWQEQLHRLAIELREAPLLISFKPTGLVH